MEAIIFSKKSSGLTLTKNETKVIIEVNKSLQNRGIFLKAITEKRGRKEGGLLNFLCQLVKAGLSLMRNVLTPLSKSVLILLGLTASASATYEAIK